VNVNPSPSAASDIDRYARCIEASKRVRWDIDKDILKGRRFDTSQKFLPDGLSLVDGLDFLTKDEQRYLSQIQGRTYANMFGLVERFINAKILEVSRDHWLGDQTKLEALVRFSDEELKHQAMFRRIERLAGEQMPEGYVFAPDPDEVAGVVLGKSTWAVLGLTLLIELISQSHYRDSMDRDPNLSALYKDVFLYHWKEESQHAIMDELEWLRHDAALSPDERDEAVDEFIELAFAVNGILQAQSASDAEYFGKTCGRSIDSDEFEAIKANVLKAYRYQYILSGADHPHFLKTLTGLITDEQANRVVSAVATLR